MSLENARNIFEAVESDKDLQEKIGNQLRVDKPADKSSAMASIIGIASENGYQCTAAEMKDVVGNMKNGELSQEVLDTIVSFPFV